METASLDWDVDPGEGTSHQPVSDHGHTGFCGDETAILTRRCNVLVFPCMIPYGQALCHALTSEGRFSGFFYKAWLRHRSQTRVGIDMSVCLFEVVWSIWVANRRRDKGFWRRDGKHRNVHDGASQAFLHVYEAASLSLEEIRMALEYCYKMAQVLGHGTAVRYRGN